MFNKHKNTFTLEDQNQKKQMRLMTKAQTRAFRKGLAIGIAVTILPAVAYGVLKTTVEIAVTEK